MLPYIRFILNNLRFQSRQILDSIETLVTFGSVHFTLELLICPHYYLGLCCVLFAGFQFFDLKFVEVILRITVVIRKQSLRFYRSVTVRVTLEPGQAFR